jgi:hypothetical protein
MILANHCSVPINLTAFPNNVPEAECGGQRPVEPSTERSEEPPRFAFASGGKEFSFHFKLLRPVRNLTQLT